jgi:basic amino acid/polyamine antiporter, APA family
MPWRRRDIFENSPIARFRVAGIPVITITGVVSAIFILFMLAEWSFNVVYGTAFSLNATSPIYFGVTYVVAIVIYLVARMVRKQQGIDLARIHREIPVE